MTTTPEEEKIYQAALSGDSAVIQLTLAGQGSIDLDRTFVHREWYTERKETALHAAVRKRHVEVVRVLIKAGAAPNTKNQLGYTPLHEAVDAHDACMDIVELLMEAGADPNARSFDGITPFHLAVKYATIDVVKLLWKHGADVVVFGNRGWTTLHWASGNRDAAVVEFLLDNGADVDLDVEDSDGEIPLFRAAIIGPVSTVELLAKRVSNLEATNKWGDTPLHCLSEEGHFDAVKVLVERGANIFAKDKAGETPLDGAILYENDIRIIDYLLGQYPETVIKEEGNLCLHSILQKAGFEDVNDDVKVVLPVGKELTMDHMVTLLEQFVFQCPECIEAQDDSGELALHVACRTACPLEVVRFLVERYPVSIRSQDNVYRVTPLHLACGSPSTSVEVLRFLVETYGEAIFLADSTGSLPLHAACHAGLDLEKIKILVEQHEGGGVNTVGARDHHRALPLHAACSASSDHDVETIKFLVEVGGINTLTARDENGALPLHALCTSNPGVEKVKCLQHHHPGLLEEKTELGDLPIVVACENLASLSVVYTLMRAHPGALMKMKTE